FLCNDTTPTDTSTLSLHDALPISGATAIVTIIVRRRVDAVNRASAAPWARLGMQRVLRDPGRSGRRRCTVLLHDGAAGKPHTARSEEHTSELQSRFDLVCRLLLEK